MNQCERIRTILQEFDLKQRDLARAIGVTESYISKLLKYPDLGLSQPVAKVIEEKYGYNAVWILTGEGPKLKQVSQDKTLSELHQQVLIELERMSDQQVKAVLVFINSLDRVEEIFGRESTD